MIIEPLGFALAMDGREREFPLLARAAEDALTANSVEIEWLVDTPDGRVAWRNYQQIFRAPYKFAAPERDVFRGDPDKKKAEQLTLLLGFVEQTLWDGRTDYRGDVPPIRWCGGVRHYLGRDPNATDVIRLRPLRDLVWRAWEEERYDHMGDRVYPDHPRWVGEWLAEASLEVAPGELVAA